MQIAGLLLVGLLGGALGGLFGISGGVVFIPALVFLFGFDQKMAQGTTLLLMLPPIGIMAAMEYYKAGMVNIKAAVILAVAFVVGSWVSSKFAVKMDSDLIRKMFAVFMMLISIRMFFAK